MHCLSLFSVLPLGFLVRSLGAGGRGRFGCFETNSKTIVLAVAFMLIIPGSLWAGNLEPSAPPESTFSLSLEDLFLRLTIGEPGTPNVFTGPSDTPDIATMYTIDEIMAVAPALDETNGATVGDVVEGKTFWGLTSGAWGLQTGTRDPCDADADGDNTPDCYDQCPNDPAKINPGQCGCGVADTDTDGDFLANCRDQCDFDPAKIHPGVCGCGNTETGDSDGDGFPDCVDGCPSQGIPSIGTVCWWDLNDCVSLTSYISYENGCFQITYSSSGACTVMDPPC